VAETNTLRPGIPCLACGSTRQRLIVALGDQPLANAYLKEDALEREEPVYPLDLYLCEDCKLVHIEVVATSQEIFSDYAYFSSFSTTWLAHARDYVSAIVPRLGLGAESFVVEIASNDGYLLQNFLERQIPCLGIEPAQNIAEVAREKGIETDVAFWGQETATALAAKGRMADLIIGNNVLAHTPMLNDFVAGLPMALKPEGVATFEFPHLLRLIEERQFDTIYHEHFSYFSFFVVAQIFASHGLRIFDVEELPTHGGSLRIYACHAKATGRETSAAVEALRQREIDSGLDSVVYYERFGEAVRGVKAGVRAFLEGARDRGEAVVAYGAPAKGNTLLNYCGVTTDLLAFTVDRNPHKQGMYLPGSRIPIYSPEKIMEEKPPYLFILPWNLKDEIMEQMAAIREWGGRFVVPIPELTILE